LVRAAANEQHGYLMDVPHSALDLLPADASDVEARVAAAAGRAHAAATASGFQMQQFGQAFNPIVDW